MDNMEYDKFLGKLYDILLKDDIIGDDDKAKDLKTKKQRLGSYLEKLERIQDKVLSKDKLDIIKELYYSKYVINSENIPNSYFELLERRYLEEGHGHINLVNPKNNEEITINRNKRKDLSYIFNCSEDEIGFNKEYLERDLIYYWGNIYIFLENNPQTVWSYLNISEEIYGYLV